MSKWICASCDYTYNPAFAFLTHGAAPGAALDDLPEDWCCPDCGAAKDYFLPIKERAAASDGAGAPEPALPIAWRRALPGAA